MQPFEAKNLGLLDFVAVVSYDFIIKGGKIIEMLN